MLVPYMSVSNDIMYLLVLNDCHLGQEYIARIEEAKKYDHRLLGVKQELFFCHPLRYKKAG